MRKTLCVLFAAAFALSSAATASAEPPVSAQALSCAAGTLCVWPDSDGSSSRCSAATDSPDWRTWCSWSSTRPVRAAYNKKTSPNYAGVCLYTATAYRGTHYFIRPGQAANPGVIIRSHRWVTSTC